MSSKASIIQRIYTVWLRPTSITIANDIHQSKNGSIVGQLVSSLSSGISIRYRFNFFPFAPRFTRRINRVRSCSTRLFDFLISCYAQEIFLDWCFVPFVVSPPLPRWYLWGFAGGRASYWEGLQERKIKNLGREMFVIWNKKNRLFFVIKFYIRYFVKHCRNLYLCYRIEIFVTNCNDDL